MLSVLRRIVLRELTKAYKLGVDISISRVIRVFNLNSSLTYKFVKELESEGIVESTKRGWWRLRDNSRARSLAEFILSQPVESAFYKYFPEVVPETYYYIAELPIQEWFGVKGYDLVIVDKRLKGRLNPPPRYKVVYTSLRGRSWRYDESFGASIGTLEQSLADLLSYDPLYPIELFLVNNLYRVDLDETARRCTPEGLRRLASFIAFYSLAVGKLIPSKTRFLRLVDNEEILSRVFTNTITWIYANDVDVRRNI